MGANMKGLFIKEMSLELDQKLEDIGYKPVNQVVYYIGTMVVNDGKLWHPESPFKPWNPDGRGWPECQVFEDVDAFLEAAKQLKPIKIQQKEFKVVIEPEYHKNIDSLGDWDGTCEKLFKYTIFDNNGYYIESSGCYRTKEEAQIEGEKATIKLQ